MNFDKISIILVDTQLPENVGLVARSMYNFGFTNLKLVSPKLEWPSEKALAVDRKSTRLNSSHLVIRMPSSA